MIHLKKVTEEKHHSKLPVGIRPRESWEKESRKQKCASKYQGCLQRSLSAVQLDKRKNCIFYRITLMLRMLWSVWCVLQEYATICVDITQLPQEIVVTGKM